MAGEEADRDFSDRTSLVVDPADAMVHGLCDIQVAAGVKGAHERLAEQRRARRPAVAVVPPLASACDRGDDALLVGHRDCLIFLELLSYALQYNGGPAYRRDSTGHMKLSGKAHLP